MPSIWLTGFAWIWISVAFITSGVVAFDIFVRGNRQQMGVMEAVYPITALYLGPLALALYWRWGRNTPDRRGVQIPTRRAAAMHQMKVVPDRAMACAPP